MNRTLVLTATILSLLAAASAQARPSCPPQLGRSADERTFSRQIVIQPNARWANVTVGEVIRFVVRSADGAESSFTWDFDTFGERNFDLGCVAPEGTLQRTVTVYLSSDPRYEGQ